MTDPFANPCAIEHSAPPSAARAPIGMAPHPPCSIQVNAIEERRQRLWAIARRERWGGFGR